MDLTKPEKAGFSSERLRRINPLMQGYVDRHELAGIITTVARHGQTVHLEKFGWMDIEAHKPMAFDTIFQIASMTKPVTSVAIMTLYEQGYFNLNTPIAKFIPAFKDTKVFVRKTDSGMELADLEQPIAFRHLFTHTAGLSYGWNENDPVDQLYQAARKKAEAAGQPTTNESLIEMLAQMPLAFQPGSYWRYSLSIDVLGRLVEVITGKPLDEYCAENIFKPLGMVDTGFYVPPEKAERVATVYGHPEPGKGLQRMERIKPHFQRPSWIMGGGGLVSTVFDYARFAQIGRG